MGIRVGMGMVMHKGIFWKKVMGKVITIINKSESKYLKKKLNSLTSENVPKHKSGSDKA